jgi:hypothetical protein
MAYRSRGSSSYPSTQSISLRWKRSTFSVASNGASSMTTGTMSCRSMSARAGGRPTDQLVRRPAAEAR